MATYICALAQPNTHCRCSSLLSFDNKCLTSYSSSYFSTCTTLVRGSLTHLLEAEDMSNLVQAYIDVDWLIDWLIWFWHWCWCQYFEVEAEVCSFVPLSMFISYYQYWYLIRRSILCLWYLWGPHQLADDFLDFFLFEETFCFSSWEKIIQSAFSFSKCVNETWDNKKWRINHFLLKCSQIQRVAPF